MESILSTHWLDFYVTRDTPDLDRVQAFVKHQGTGMFQVPNAKVIKNNIIFISIIVAKFTSFREYFFVNCS